MALSAPSALAADVGSSVVDLGGDATDVVVAMALAAMCSEPGVCAPGAGGFITVDPAGAPPSVYDGYMAVPGLDFEGEVVARTVTMEYGGGITTAVGPGSIAVPGGFAALAKASSRHGVVPWRELLDIVADSVEDGFPLSPACRTYLVDSGEPVFSSDPAVRSALFDGGTLKDTGDLVRFDDLGESLRQIGAEGAETFYRGDMARAIVEDLAERGSSLTATDLASYRAIERDPLTVDVHGWEAAANPPPAIGGITMLSAVRNIAGADEPLQPRTWSRVLATAFEQRSAYEDSYADDDAIEQFMVASGLRSPSTIAVAAVDRDGSAAAATFSAGYGSGVVPKGTGLLMNNSLGELELLPEGVEGLVPGRRMMSNMTPTTCRSADSVVAISSPGADRITSALALTLVRLLVAGDSFDAAIEHPRLHPESLDPLRLAAERGLEDLPGDVRWYEEPHMFFGGVNGAALIDGNLVAHADSRRVGSARVV